MKIKKMVACLPVFNSLTEIWSWFSKNELSYRFNNALCTDDIFVVLTYLKIQLSKHFRKDLDEMLFFYNCLTKHLHKVRSYLNITNTTAFWQIAQLLKSISHQTHRDVHDFFTKWNIHLSIIAAVRIGLWRSIAFLLCLFIILGPLPAALDIWTQ